jgi:hypothetical protein
MGATNVEVVRHDILSDELGMEEFDRAHVRHLLIWLAQRELGTRRVNLAGITSSPGGTWSSSRPATSRWIAT